jgi:hypothetical protein
LLSTGANPGHRRSFFAWLNEAEHCRQSFEYWPLQNILLQSMIEALLVLPLAPPGLQKFVGQRDANHSTRADFTLGNQSWFSSSATISPPSEASR